MLSTFKFQRLNSREINGQDFVIASYKNESGVDCEFLTPIENLKFLPMGWTCTLRDVPQEDTIQATNAPHDNETTAR